MGKSVLPSSLLARLCEVSYINNEIIIYTLRKNARIEGCFLSLADISSEMEVALKVVDSFRSNKDGLREPGKWKRLRGVSNKSGFE